jgi:hypothetical protein
MPSPDEEVIEIVPQTKSESARLSKLSELADSPSHSVMVDAIDS